jgi:hypothetical protein
MNPVASIWSFCQEEKLGDHHDNSLWRCGWDGKRGRQFGQWHGIRRQHRWHGFYKFA